MTRDNETPIGKVALAIIYLVGERKRSSVGAGWIDDIGDDVSCFDAGELAPVLSNHLLDTAPITTTSDFLVLLERVRVSETGATANTCRNLQVFLEGTTDRPKHHRWRLDPEHIERYGLACSFEQEPIDRALIWQENELAAPVARWTARWDSPARGLTSGNRHMLFVQTKEGSARQDYVILVHSVARARSAARLEWIDRHEPTIVKFENPYWHRDQFESVIPLGLSARELLLCVVRLDAEKNDDDGEPELGFALEQIAGLLSRRLHGAPAEESEDGDSVGGNYDAWFSLRSCAEAFLGDGPRRRRLTTHRAGKPASARKGPGAPDLD